MRLLALVPLFLTLVLVDPVLVNKALAQVNVGGPTDVRDPAYPLRVRILTRNASRTSYGAMRMWGRADLFLDQQEQGFDYESTCDELLMVTHGDERYSARWKKQDKELEMLLSKVGTGKRWFVCRSEMHRWVPSRGSSVRRILHPKNQNAVSLASPVHCADNRKNV